MLKPRSVLLASVCLLPSLLGPDLVGDGKALAQTPGKRARPAPAPQQQTGGTVQAIQVVGNQRIETGTIQSYMVIQQGDPFDSNKVNLSLKTLYATGLFQNVSITRQGNTLVVNVVENPTVGQVYFQGNKAISDKDATAAISLKPRSVYTPAAAEADRRALLNLYAQKGHFDASVTPNIIRLPDNRVNVVFQCSEGSVTKVSRITFVGNEHFSQSKLRSVVSSRQSAWYRFLSSADQFNSQRMEYDEALLRQFYLHEGYADFRMNSANAELSPDRKSFYLTYNFTEGPRYRVKQVEVVSDILGLSAKQLRGLVPIHKGEWFDGSALADSITAISTKAQDLGFPFAQVNPDVKTDPASRTLTITLDVVQGPQIYIQRTDITGNTRTEDKVIRRELTVADGDAYSQTKIDASKANLKNLGFFKDETITTSPGTTPQQVILDTKVTEQSTGQFSLGGGYSSDLGALLNAGLSQNNFGGSGVNASINAMLAQRGTQINIGATQPYFLDRNLIAGFDLFRTVTDSYTTSSANYAYSESSIGADVRLGYRFNDNVRQSFTYTISQRNVYNIQSGSSLYILDEKGTSSQSQISQTITFDFVDNDQNPTSGLMVDLTTDYAGLGGTAKYGRISPDASYYLPLERIFGSKAWVLKFSGTAGFLIPTFGYQDRVIDRFFVGGDSLRGFADGGVGPHDIATGDSLGGNTMWTGTAELQFPLPVSPDLGVNGFAFVDTGTAYGIPNSEKKFGPAYDSSAPRVGAGVGIAWNTPFGLIDLSVADPVVKKRYDQTQAFRVSFGTRF